MASVSAEGSHRHATGGPGGGLSVLGSSDGGGGVPLASSVRWPVLAALAPVGRGWLSHCGLAAGGTFPRPPHRAGSVADTGAVLLT